MSSLKRLFFKIIDTYSRKGKATENSSKIGKTQHENDYLDDVCIRHVLGRFSPTNDAPEFLIDSRGTSTSLNICETAA